MWIRRGRRGLSAVVAAFLEIMQVFVSDVAGDVLPRETGRIKLADRRIVMAHGPDEAVQILVDQPISPNKLCDFIDVAAIRYTGGAAEAK
jgi:hypothetical protein